MVCAALTLLNAIILAPVALLELIKYPLIKLFSPLGLNVAQLSFLFNVSDVDSDSQSVHTPSFERSVVQCVQELKAKYATQPNVLDQEFENYINNSEELTKLQNDLLKSYLNFNQPNVNNSNVNYYNWRTWQESKTKLTLTQTVNLVLTAARDQKLEMDTLKCMILIRLNEGNGKCPLGMFNRIIYALKGLEAKNNFLVGVNEQVCNKMPKLTKQFFLGCSREKIKFLKDNFDNFYFRDDMNPNDTDSQVKNDMSKLMEDAAQYVFNKLYVEYYNNYGKKFKVVEVVDGVKKVKEF